MICPFDDTPMLHTDREEVEAVGTYVLITRVIMDECPICSALNKFTRPLTPTGEAHTQRQL
jgi:hypothetical protein